MSAIELERIWNAIHELRASVSAVTSAANGRMDNIQGGVDALGEDLRALRASMDALTRCLETQMTASMQAYIDATLDVLKMEMRAYVRGLVPVGLAAKQ